jgi:hypothetical protein
MKTCSVEGCEKPVFGKGWCSMHYDRARRGETGERFLSLLPLPLKWKEDDPRYKNKGRVCDVEGCENPFYAKGICHKHYERLSRTGSLHLRPKPLYPDTCRVDGCSRKSLTRGYCAMHYDRVRSGRPLDWPIGNGGRLNPQWKGGVFEYPNHYTMKKIRLEVLEEAGYICEYCGGPANQVHHKDHSKDNHVKENLAACCHRCNARRRKGKNIRFIGLYGASVRKIRKAFGLSKNEVYQLHYKGELARYVALM